MNEELIFIYTSYFEIEDTSKLFAEGSISLTKNFLILHDNLTYNGLLLSHKKSYKSESVYLYYFLFKLFCDVYTETESFKRTKIFL